MQDEYYSVQQLVDSGRLPNFGYQLQFGSDDHVVEKAVKEDGMLGKFLTAMYGGKLSSGRTAMDPEKGVNLEAVREDEIGMSPLFDKEVSDAQSLPVGARRTLTSLSQELDYYISQFSKNTFEGPCNWYRTRKANWEDDQTLPEEPKRQIKYALTPTSTPPSIHPNLLTKQPQTTHPLHPSQARQRAHPLHERRHGESDPQPHSWRGAEQSLGTVAYAAGDERDH